MRDAKRDDTRLPLVLALALVLLLGGILPASAIESAAAAPPSVVEDPAFAFASELGRDGDGNDSQGDWFGYDVAAGDNTVVISIVQDDRAAFRGGAVAILERVGAAWQYTQTVTAPDADLFDEFGLNPQIDGDTMVVGFRGRGSIPSKPHGAAWVFERIGGVWLASAKLESPAPEPYDGFGQYMAISGNTIVVSSAGGAWVFERDTNGWTATGRLTASGPLAIDGDTAAVGGTHYGHAQIHLFQRTAGAWGLEAVVSAPDAVPQDWYGGMDLQGDLLVFSASHDDTEHGVDSGSIWVFRRGAAGWAPEQQVIPLDAQPGGTLSAPRIHGDTLLFNSTGWTNPFSGERDGAAWLYRRGTHGFTRHHVIHPAGDGPGNWWATDIHGDSVVIADRFENDDSHGESWGVVRGYRMTDRMAPTMSTAP